MSGVCPAQMIYRPFLNKQITTSTVDLIVIGTLLPIQFIFMVMVLLKGYKRFGKILMDKRNDVVEKRRQLIDVHSQQIQNGNIDARQFQSIQQANKQTVENQNYQNPQKNNKNRNLIQFIFYKHPSRAKLLLTFFCFLSLLLIISILLTLSFLSIYQTASYTYPQTQCQLSQSINNFRKGSTKWLGLQNLLSNVTQLTLVLNTRIQVSINAIKGLMLNGTVATIKPGLGFANRTNITVINRQSPLNFTNVTVTSVKSNINASTRYWLFMNSSLSINTFFPVCQDNRSFPIQHPLVTNETIELDYMNDICQKVTKQLDDLVQNGGKVDKLLVDLQEVKLGKNNLESNLSALNGVYAPIASRSNEYQSQFSSLGHDFSIISRLSIVSVAVYGGLSMLMISYFVSMLGLSFCCASESSSGKQQTEEQSSVDVVLSQRGQQNMRKNKGTNGDDKFYNISSLFPKLIMFLFLTVNIIIGVESFLAIQKSLQISKNCQKFNMSLQDPSTIDQLPLSQSQTQLLKPISQCIQNPSSYFMQSVPLVTSRLSLQKLYSLSGTYNASVPKDVFKVDSLAQVQTLRQYLFHLETMPIKSKQFNLLQLLNQVNLYSNGSYPNSKQLIQCGRAVIQDQYVYNSVDCKHKLMDLVTELTITEPRCIIIPTYDGTPGTVTTHLNEAQHTFVLDATCPSINNMFSRTNTSCFLSKRLALLQGQNCTNTAKELATRLQNIVRFSQKASQYTDIYMQNLRNFFGIYARASTNLTEFFAGANMSQTMAAFGVLSNNLLNKTKCDQIKPIVESFYNTYCPQDNSIPKLLSEAYVWTIIVVVAVFIQSVVFFLLDVFLRVYKIDKFYGQITDHKISKKVLPENIYTRDIIEISQETLVRDDPRQDDRIYQDYFSRIPKESPLHQPDPIIIVAETTEPNTETKRKFENSHTLDETGILFDKYNPSPMKSINPYGNPIDEVIEYPNIGNTPIKKQQPSQDPPLQTENKLSSNQINLLSSIKKSNMVNNEIFDEKDSSIQQKNKQQSKKKEQRYSRQRQGKLRMSQTARRFKKVNVETDEKKIMPQLFFNLDDNNNKKSPKSKGKIRSNNESQHFSQKGDKIQELRKSKNYLQINLHDEEEEARNARDIEVMNLGKNNRAKQSKQRGKNKQEDRKESLTAR